jgi:hypothetical protein
MTKKKPMNSAVQCAWHQVLAAVPKPLISGGLKTVDGFDV